MTTIIRADHHLSSPSRRPRHRRLLAVTIVGGALAAGVFPGSSASAEVGDATADFVIDQAVTGMRISQAATTPLTLSDGSVVVPWHASNAAEGTGTDVYARRYTAAGEEAGEMLRLSSIITGSQSAASLAPLDGGFIAVWQSNDLSGTDTALYHISGRLFAADGTALGDEFEINTTTAGSQTGAKIARLADGRFIVTFLSPGATGNVLRARFLDTDGTPIGEDFAVNTTTNVAFPAGSVAALSDGGFVVTWGALGTGTGSDGDGGAVRATRFDATGAVVGTSDFLVNTTSAGDQATPWVTATSTGFVVTFASAENSGDIRARWFGLDGVPIGDDFTVTATTDGAQATPSVVAFADGRLLIGWMDSTELAMNGRVIAADGSAGDQLVLGTPSAAGWAPNITIVNGTSAFVTRRQSSPAPITLWGRVTQVIDAIEPEPDSGTQTLVVDVPDPGDGEFVWSVDGGGAVSLGTAVASGDHWSASGQLNQITVTDTRAGRPAWAISGQLGDFTDLPGSAKYLGWAPTIITDGAGAGPGAAVVSGFLSGNGLSAPATLASAGPGHEPGSATVGAELDLQLPIDTPPDTYTAVLTITAVS